jgi:hypothetical protein
VEAIFNGVQAFKQPASRTQHTLLTRPCSDAVFR